MCMFIHIITTPFYITHFAVKGLRYAHLKGQTFSEAFQPDALHIPPLSTAAFIIKIIETRDCGN